MKSIEQIVAKMNDPVWADLFGARNGDLIEFLPFDRAKAFLKPDVTEEQWTAGGMPKALTRDTVVREITAYMPFAWGKANDCRGLSAARSIMHMQAWLWLLDADDAVKAIEEYDCYGKAQLRGICEALGINWQALDDGHWRTGESDEGTPAGECIPITIPA
jgi:hypothetical protein